MDIKKLLEKLLGEQPLFGSGMLFVIFGVLLGFLIFPIGGLLILVGLALLIINLIKPKKR